MFFKKCQVFWGSDPWQLLFQWEKKTQTQCLSECTRAGLGFALLSSAPGVTAAICFPQGKSITLWELWVWGLAVNHWLWDVKQVTALSGLHTGVQSCFMFQFSLSHKFYLTLPFFSYFHGLLRLSVLSLAFFLLNSFCLLEITELSPARVKISSCCFCPNSCRAASPLSFQFEFISLKETMVPRPGQRSSHLVLT